MRELDTHNARARVCICMCVCLCLCLVRVQHTFCALACCMSCVFCARTRRGIIQNNVARQSVGQDRPLPLVSNVAKCRHQFSNVAWRHFRRPAGLSPLSHPNVATRNVATSKCPQLKMSPSVSYITASI